MKRYIKYYNDLTQGEVVLFKLTNKLNTIVDLLVPRHAGETALANVLLKLTIRTIHRQILSRLRKDKLIESVNGSYRVTKLGKNYVTTLIKKIKGDQKIRWDHLWRVIIFDIPETRKKDRALLRRLMYSTGFRKLQASVWISPYPIPRDFNEVLWEHRLKKHILYLLVKKIDYNPALHKIFPEFFK